jgi:hypothetical protein
MVHQPAQDQVVAGLAQQRGGQQHPDRQQDRPVGGQDPQRPVAQVGAQVREGRAVRGGGNNG